MSRPQRLVVNMYDPNWEPEDKWALVIWRRIPKDGTKDGILYDEVLKSIPYPVGHIALAGMAAEGRVRAWEEAPGINMVARGPFRACDYCGSLAPPGACRICFREPAANGNAEPERLPPAETVLQARRDALKLQAEELAEHEPAMEFLDPDDPAMWDQYTP